MIAADWQNDPRFEAARRLCNRLTAAGHRALFAGGCVRDLILRVSPKDYDIATSARPEEIAALFDKTVGIGAAFGVMAVTEEGTAYEVASFRSDGPYADGRRPSDVRFTGEREDAQRRDFTINAMFYDPAKGEVLDYVGGQADLDAGIIRTVGDPDRRFNEDRLRLLRGVRFAARLGCTIETETFAAMQHHAQCILQTSAERIRDELIMMLTEGHARQAFELLDQAGLLAEILPEAAHMKGIEQPSKFHPEGDVWAHTLLMLEYLPKGCTPTLALATLLHDVGKPLTQTFEDRIRFHEHDRRGARIAGQICRRLRLPNAATERVVWLVGQHMRLAHIPQMRESKRKRFFRESGFAELRELGRIDALASHGKLDVLEWIDGYEKTAPAETLRPQPLLTGHDLIAMGFTPGPQFSAILSALEDAQLEGTIRTPAEAELFVREHFGG